MRVCVFRKNGNWQGSLRGGKGRACASFKAFCKKSDIVSAYSTSKCRIVGHRSKLDRNRSKLDKERSKLDFSKTKESGVAFFWGALQNEGDICRIRQCWRAPGAASVAKGAKALGSGCLSARSRLFFKAYSPLAPKRKTPRVWRAALPRMLMLLAVIPTTRG